jgi:hypothetical protein
MSAMNQRVKESMMDFMPTQLKHVVAIIDVRLVKLLAMKIVQNESYSMVKHVMMLIR